MSALSLLAALPLLIDAHVDELHGFQIDVPEGWSSNQQTVGKESFIFQILPPGSIGMSGVTVTIVETKAETDPKELVKLTRDKVTGEDAEGFSEYKESEVEFLGRKAPHISVDYVADAGEFRIVQTFVVEAELGYILQIHAPPDEFDDRKEELNEVLATFGFVERGEAALAEQILIDLADKCGSEVDWAKDWDDAAKRARAENKLVLVSAFMIPGFAINDTPKTSTFVDVEVVELVNERFVPLWYERGMDAAFIETYGMGSSTFGQGILLVTPDGDVVLQTHAATQADVVFPFLLAGLARNPKFAGTEVEEDLPILARAQRHVARGEHAVALALIEEDTSAAAHRLRAKIFRLGRRGPEALAALAAAREAGDTDEAALLVQEAALRLREGQQDRARTLFDRVIADHAGTEAANEASLIRGMLAFPANGEAGKQRWRDLTESAPESRWAWQAAAALRSTLIDVAEDVELDHGWPDTESLAELLTFPEKAPLKPSRASEAAEDALTWLLEAQHEDGSWLTATEVSTPEGMGPDPFVDAITAICGRALLAHGKGDGNEEAARRALSFLINSIARREEEPPMVLFMDYMTWSNSMMLHFISDALEQGLGDVEGLAPTVNVLLADLDTRQREGGGWSYYVSSDIEGDGAPSNSISFTTAAAVIALARARDAGFRIPAEVLDPAIDALERMRGDDGIFAYFLFHDTGTTQSGTGDPGAVGRGPACEFALYEVGKSSKKRLESALEKFLKYRHLYSAEQGKSFMHAGPHAQGCHYLFFDYTHAAFVHDELGRNSKARTQLLELVLDARQPDGSFVDTPLMGRAYGTAMALLALDALH